MPPSLITPTDTQAQDEDLTLNLSSPTFNVTKYINQKLTHPTNPLPSTTTSNKLTNKEITKLSLEMQILTSNTNDDISRIITQTCSSVIPKIINSNELMRIDLKGFQDDMGVYSQAITTQITSSSVSASDADDAKSVISSLRTMHELKSSLSVTSKILENSLKWDVIVKEINLKVLHASANDDNEIDSMSTVIASYQTLAGCEKTLKSMPGKETRANSIDVVRSQIITLLRPVLILAFNTNTNTNKSDSSSNTTLRKISQCYGSLDSLNTFKLEYIKTIPALILKKWFSYSKRKDGLFPVWFKGWLEAVEEMVGSERGRVGSIFSASDVEGDVEGDSDNKGSEEGEEIIRAVILETWNVISPSLHTRLNDSSSASSLSSEDLDLDVYASTYKHITSFYTTININDVNLLIKLTECIQKQFYPLTNGVYITAESNILSNSITTLLPSTGVAVSFVIADYTQAMKSFSKMVKVFDLIYNSFSDRYLTLIHGVGYRFYQKEVVDRSLTSFFTSINDRITKVSNACVNNGNPNDNDNKNESQDQSQNISTSLSKSFEWEHCLASFELVKLCNTCVSSLHNLHDKLNVDKEEIRLNPTLLSAHYSKLSNDSYESSESSESSESINLSSTALKALKALTLTSHTMIYNTCYAIPCHSLNSISNSRNSPYFVNSNSKKSSRNNYNASDMTEETDSYSVLPSEHMTVLGEHLLGLIKGFEDVVLSDAELVSIAEKSVSAVEVMIVKSSGGMCWDGLTNESVSVDVVEALISGSKVMRSSLIPSVIEIYDNNEDEDDESDEDDNNNDGCKSNELVTQYCNAWLFAIGFGVVGAYLNLIFKGGNKLTNAGRTQLLADLSYLTNVLTALGLGRDFCVLLLRHVTGLIQVESKSELEVCLKLKGDAMKGEGGREKDVCRIVRGVGVMVGEMRGWSV